MKKITTLFIGICLLISTVAGNISAKDIDIPTIDPAPYEEEWECNYQGNWNSYNGDGDEFKWDVIWFALDNGWHISGDYSGPEGSSSLDGDCADNACELYQVYSSGDVKGNAYTWYGEYTDEWIDDETTINNFTGTWGYEENYDDGGTWEAVAECHLIEYLP